MVWLMAGDIYLGLDPGPIVPSLREWDSAAGAQDAFTGRNGLYGLVIPSRVFADDDDSGPASLLRWILESPYFVVDLSGFLRSGWIGKGESNRDAAEFLFELTILSEIER